MCAIPAGAAEHSKERLALSVSRLFRAAGAMALACWLAGCGGSGGEEASVEQSAAESVAAILEDGVVTDEEYETAFFRMYDCVVESGIEVSAPNRDADGQFEFLIYGIDDIETSPIEARYRECEDMHYVKVVGAWIEQNGIGDYEGEGTLHECLFGPEANAMSPEEEARQLQSLSDEVLDACLG